MKKTRRQGHTDSRTLLEKAGGVCILFTEANPKVLNNSGVGYKEKLSSRFKDQGNKSALYLEAMAIMEVKAQRPEFKIYIVDGINHTAEQLAFNLMNGAPSFGPVDKWRAFINGGCELEGAQQLDPPVPTQQLAAEDDVVAHLTEAEACFREAVSTIYSREGGGSSFQFRRHCLQPSKDVANWFVADRVVSALHGRLSGQQNPNASTKGDLAREIWHYAEGKLSFAVAESQIDDEGSISIKFPFVAPARPAVPAALDRQKLNRPEHINWLQVGMAIREVGPLLAVVMHDAAIDFHASLLASMTNRGSGNKTLYTPGRGGSDEEEWATEIKLHHMGGWFRIERREYY